MSNTLTQIQIDRIKKIAYSIHPARKKRACVSYLQRLYELRELTIKKITGTLLNLNHDQVNTLLNELEKKNNVPTKTDTA